MNSWKTLEDITRVYNSPNMQGLNKVHTNGITAEKKTRSTGAINMPFSSRVQCLNVDMSEPGEDQPAVTVRLFLKNITWQDVIVKHVNTY